MGTFQSQKPAPVPTAVSALRPSRVHGGETCAPIPPGGSVKEARPVHLREMAWRFLGHPGLALITQGAREYNLKRMDLIPTS